MPLKIIRNDITKLTCDAIVNAANPTLLGGGGVDGAIHKAAGKGLLLECMKLGGCKTGQAKITGGHQLPCKYVIHTVGPKWRGGTNGERELLESCYRESLRLALEYDCSSVAFPLISSGVYGYPKDQALKVAVDSITTFLLEHDMLVYIVVFDKASFQIGEKLFADIAAFIDDRYVAMDPIFRQTRRDECDESTVLYSAETVLPDEADQADQAVFPPDFAAEESKAAAPGSPDLKRVSLLSLKDVLNQEEESFSQALLRKIDEKGMTDSQCYKKANVDRKLFSKIRSNINYHPSKTTAIAFAIALELSLDETKDLLQKAGFALSHSNKFDLIIEYFISSGNYNIFEINEALFAFDQELLGV